MYDRQCRECGEIKLDCFEPVSSPVVACLKCGAPTDRVWLQRAPAAIGDDIPGGFLIEHIPGLIGRKAYSKSELRRLAASKGYVQHVDHVTPKGTDKAPHTKRWY